MNDGSILSALQELNGHMRVAAVKDILDDYPRPLAALLAAKIRVAHTQEAYTLAVNSIAHTLPEDWAETVKEDLLPLDESKWDKFHQDFNRGVAAVPLTGKDKVELDNYREELLDNHRLNIERRYDDPILSAKTRSEVLRLESEKAAELERVVLSQGELARLMGKESEISTRNALKAKRSANPLLKDGLTPPLRTILKQRADRRGSRDASF